jgi:phosphoribosylanthranilate isomerase
MFRVKICGITNVEDAVAAVEAGADAIGLNFYEKSPRFVNGKLAAAIIRQARASAAPSHAQFGGVAYIGVFVNSSFQSIVQMGQRAVLTGCQLHGDEPPELVAKLRTRVSMPPEWWKVIRARRFDNGGVAAIANDLAACATAGSRPDAVLIDSATPGRYGGTGETVSWVGIADHRLWLSDTPLILAGGLTPDNVAEAIRIVRPQAVDVASGVESSPGKKDPAKVRNFVAAARTAFDAFG